jgi:hypothetical protein
MEKYETTDLKEVQRLRLVQFSGQSRTFKLGESTVTGFVKAVHEVKSSNSPRWIVTVVSERGRSNAVSR